MCQLEQDRYQFLDVDQIQVDFPNYYFKRDDDELGCQLQVNIDSENQIYNHLDFVLLVERQQHPFHLLRNKDLARLVRFLGWLVSFKNIEITC